MQIMQTVDCLKVNITFQIIKFYKSYAICYEGNWQLSRFFALPQYLLKKGHTVKRFNGVCKFIAVNVNLKQSEMLKNFTTKPIELTQIFLIIFHDEQHAEKLTQNRAIDCEQCYNYNQQCV